MYQDVTAALLHVPKANLADALLEIRRVLAPGGLSCKKKRVKPCNLAPAAAY